MKPTDNPPVESLEPLDEINEDSYLREEDAKARYDARMAEMDRKDEAGPHWRWRG